MSAPDRIYIHTGDCDDTYYELSDCCDDEVDYIRTDIHEAEITALKAEIAALKAPPKVLSAEEVTEVGWYWARFGSSWDQIIEFYPPGGFEFPSHGQFIGPIKMPEV